MAIHRMSHGVLDSTALCLARMPSTLNLVRKKWWDSSGTSGGPRPCVFEVRRASASNSETKQGVPAHPLLALVSLNPRDLLLDCAGLGEFFLLLAGPTGLIPVHRTLL